MTVTPLQTSRYHRAQPHPQIEAIRAFSDNYIWLIRAPGARAHGSTRKRSNATFESSTIC